MNNVLNGTSWGETPEPELKVPDLDVWRREIAMEDRSADAWQACAESMMRGRRMRRRAEARQRDERIGMAFMIAMLVFMVIALNLIEVFG